MVMATVVAAFFAASGAQATITPRMADFDLEKVQHKEATCADRSPADDIIVCAPKNMNIWISDALKAKFVPKPLRGEFTGPLNAETKLHVIQSQNPAVVTPAAAVTLASSSVGPRILRDRTAVWVAREEAVSVRL